MTPMKLHAADISAVVLSAGFSSRMKAFKPLLPLGDRRMVEICIDLFAGQGIKDIIVVTGHNRERLEPVVKKRGATPAFNPDFASGMLSSIQQGVRHTRRDCRGFFLLPVDIPGIRPGTIEKLIHEFLKDPRKIIMPCFDKKTGHPPVLPSFLKKDITNLDDTATLRDLIRSNAGLIENIHVHDQGILMDADTKEGFEKIREKFSFLDIPTREECLSIIDRELPGEEKIRAHMASVCMTAVKLAHAVRENLNADLVIAASLLHDIKRKEKNHAGKGARLLREIGFETVADIIAQHMDITVDIDCLKEKEVVFFADKICNGRRIDLNYTKRFAQSLKKAPWAVSNISKRYESTRLIHTKIEASAGRSVKDILSAGQSCFPAAPRTDSKWW